MDEAETRNDEVDQAEKLAGIEHQLTVLRNDMKFMIEQMAKSFDALHRDMKHTMDIVAKSK